MGQRKKDGSNCPHCINRNNIGLCKCSFHCRNHKFTSHDEQMKLQKAHQKRIDEEEKLRLEKVNKLRPKIMKYG